MVHSVQYNSYHLPPLFLQVPVRDNKDHAAGQILSLAREGFEGFRVGSSSECSSDEEGIGGDEVCPAQHTLSDQLKLLTPAASASPRQDEEGTQTSQDPSSALFLRQQEDKIRSNKVRRD